MLAHGIQKYFTRILWTLTLSIIVLLSDTVLCWLILNSSRSVFIFIIPHFFSTEITSCLFVLSRYYFTIYQVSQAYYLSLLITSRRKQQTSRLQSLLFSLKQHANSTCIILSCTFFFHT